MQYAAGRFKDSLAFYIKGPVFVENAQYGDIRVAIVAKDNSILSNPIVDLFTLVLYISSKGATNPLKLGHIHNLSC
jgi:hypothetical protein